MKSKLLEINSKNIQTTSQYIRALLVLQAKHLRTYVTADSKNGFLISRFSEEELLGLVCKGATFHLKFNDDELIGYVLITRIEEFTDLLERDDGATFRGVSRDIEKHVLSDIKFYLYQIAVAPAVKGSGIGRALLAEVMTKIAAPILTDVLTKPVENEVSLRFFKANGFDSIGVLSLPSYRDFGKLESEVLLWKPECM